MAMDQNESALDPTVSPTGTVSRLQKGFVAGVLATVIMTVFLLLGMAMGGSPYPEPVPLAIVGAILGTGAPTALIVVVGSLCHLVYGGVWAAVFSILARPISEGRGVSLGVVLWLVEQVAVVPFLGWGVFGAAIASTIAANSIVILAGTSLIFHLIYGLAVGMLLNETTSYQIFRG